MSFLTLMNQIFYDMKYTVSIFLILVSVAIFGFRASKDISFDQNVKGYLKRAADSNTIGLAHGELTKAINYLEQNKLTTGYTSILWKTPNEEIDFWYQNLKASQNELFKVKDEASQLEKTNVLIKLRETLMDTGKKTKVTIPKGLSVYPDNLMWAILMTIAIACGIIGFAGIAVKIEELEKARKAKKAAKDNA